jgi:hypothetical protein
MDVVLPGGVEEVPGYNLYYVDVGLRAPVQTTAARNADPLICGGHIDRRTEQVKR